MKVKTSICHEKLESVKKINPPGNKFFNQRFSFFQLNGFIVKTLKKLYPLKFLYPNGYFFFKIIWIIIFQTRI